ncbi:hypothetical protein K3495_g10342 [Podosphaera aphanis]|nr:hypothetical protein K3495_g10342 [Podosphaera aphanis]
MPNHSVRSTTVLRPHKTRSGPQRSRAQVKEKKSSETRCPSLQTHLPEKLLCQIRNTAAAEASVYPPEPHAVLEAEKRRAARIKAHLSICSTAINSVEAALSSLSTGENKSFVDGTKVHLRAAIAQFVHTGPGSTPPSLPARPSYPLPSKAPLKRAPTPAAPQEQITKSTWATVARNGLCHSAGPPTTKQVPIPRKTKKSISKTKVIKPLFLRLHKENMAECFAIVPTEKYIYNGRSPFGKYLPGTAGQNWLCNNNNR